MFPKKKEDTTEEQEEKEKEKEQEGPKEPTEQDKANYLRSLFGMFSPDTKDDDKNDIEMSKVYKEKEESSLLPSFPT